MEFFTKLFKRLKENPRTQIVLGIPGEGIKYPAIYDFVERDMMRHYYEFLLIRYWSKNKNSDGVFEFEPINVRRKYTNPLYIDGLKYDTSSRNECSLYVLVSTATDDKLMFRRQGEEEFSEAPVFRTEELMWLVRRLNEKVGRSLWYTTENAEEKKQHHEE